jgi:hypothetical protein
LLGRADGLKPDRQEAGAGDMAPKEEPQ